MLIPLSALSAFRHDLAADPDAATSADARWLQALTLLQTAVDVPAAVRGGILDAVAGLADPDALGPGGVRAPLPLTMRHELPPVLALAVRTGLEMEDAARFQLAYATYDAVLRLAVSEVADPRARAEAQGVVLTLQGRIARKLGDTAAAKERYAAAEAIGQEHHDRSIQARAWTGYGIVAQIRGNMPEARRWFTQVLSERDAARESMQVAHQAMMVAAASGGDYARAAEHGWACYELAVTQGNDEEAAAALADLSQLTYDSGRPLLALRGFSASLLRAGYAPHRRLPALGGAAMAAAAALGAAGLGLIRSYRDQVESLAATTRLPFEHGLAFADLGDAYAMLGDAGNAASVRARARQLAQAHGFFELLYRVTEGARPVASPTKAASGPAARPAVMAIDGAQPILERLAGFPAEADVEEALATAGR